MGFVPLLDGAHRGLDVYFEGTQIGPEVCLNVIVVLAVCVLGIADDGGEMPFNVAADVLCFKPTLMDAVALALLLWFVDVVYLDVSEVYELVPMGNIFVAKEGADDVDAVHGVIGVAVVDVPLHGLGPQHAEEGFLAFAEHGRVHPSGQQAVVGEMEIVPLAAYLAIGEAVLAEICQSFRLLRTGTLDVLNGDSHYSNAEASWVL